MQSWVWLEVYLFIQPNRINFLDSMATKGLAVSQIILLVLGIIVLAVVAYLLYTNFVGTNNTVNAEQCRAAATRACTSCSLIGGDTKQCDAIYLDGTGKQCALPPQN